jgi:hypothetical protein
MCYTLQGYTVYTIDSDLVILLDHLQLRSIYTLYEILLCSLHTNPHALNLGQIKLDLSK